MSREVVHEIYKICPEDLDDYVKDGNANCALEVFVKNVFQKVLAKRKHALCWRITGECPTHAPATIAPGVNRNVIARTKPNPNPIPYPILNLKVNHYEDVKPFLPEILSPEQLSLEQMSDHRMKWLCGCLRNLPDVVK